MKSKRVWIVLAITVIIVAITWVGIHNRRPELVASAYVMPEISDIQDSLTLRGQLIEQGRVSVYVPGPCQVLSSAVRIGQTVGAGQVLMVVELLEEGTATGAALTRELRSATQGLLSSGLEDIEEKSDDLAQALAQGLARQGELEYSAGQQLEIVSSVGGVIMSAAQPGDTLSGLLPVVEVSDMGKLALRASVGESYVHLLEEGQACTVAVEALNASGMTGTVRTIMPYAQQTGLITQGQEIKTQVIVSIDSRDADLRPGYSSTAEITTAVVHNSITLPYEAIGQDEENREYVMIYADGLALRRYIQTGRELDSCVQILAGVEPQDRVLLTPGLAHGQAVSLS